MAYARQTNNHAKGCKGGSDVAAAVRALEARGVAFADVDLPGLKTVGHVATLPGEKAAWFHDPEGNILCVHQELP
jgi:hypothetical protein